jgi:uncharacterized protein YgiM (DUF1202 family)
MLRRRILFALLILCAAALGYAQEKSVMTVMNKEAEIRDKPSFLGKILEKVPYGTKVTVIEKQKIWVKVSRPSGKGEGWMSLSALKEGSIDLKTGDSNVATTASSGEVSAAGKGFTKEIEDQYKKDKNLDYAPVDAMEKYVVTPEQAAKFMKDGGLAAEL